MPSTSLSFVIYKKIYTQSKKVKLCILLIVQCTKGSLPCQAADSFVSPRVNHIRQSRGGYTLFLILKVIKPTSLTAIVQADLNHAAVCRWYPQPFISVTPFSFFF